MFRFLVGVVVGITLIVGGAYLWLTKGHPPVATADAQLPFERQITSVPLDARIQRELPASIPIQPSEANFVAGAHIYRQQCAFCHAVYGNQSKVGGRMFPAAPPLWEKHGNVVGVSDDPAGETYWKVANGIRLSGMPATKRFCRKQRCGRSAYCSPTPTSLYPQPRSPCLSSRCRSIPQLRLSHRPLPGSPHRFNLNPAKEIASMNLKQILAFTALSLMISGSGNSAPLAQKPAATLKGDVAHPAHTSHWVDTQLYFGLGPADAPDKGVTESAWREFLDKEVTTRFPAGLSVMDVYGQWQGKQENVPERIRSKMLVIDYPATAANNAKVEAIRAAWKQRTGDLSVLRITRAADVSF